MELTLAQTADKYRNQRDVLAAGLTAIVKEDANGKGYFARIAIQVLENMLATDHEYIPEHALPVEAE
jgi:hypothetical protein